MQIQPSTVTSSQYAGPLSQGMRPAAVYIRESELDQGLYSPDEQLACSTAILNQHGYAVVMVERDSEEGDRAGRPGYQRILSAIRTGQIEAVGVYKMSRWGRGGVERLRILEELDRLKVPVYDAQRGKADTPGLERYVHTAVDEQFLRDLSWTITRTMPRAARDGKHLGPTPIGYKRIYPEGMAYDKHRCADLVPDAHYRWVVEQVFQRYVAGSSPRQLARWLNSIKQTYPNPHHKEGGWNADLLRGMLRNRIYVGEIEWGKRRCGKYNQYQGPVLRSGEDGCKMGRHEPLIDRALFEEAQMKLGASAAGAPLTRRGHRAALLQGILRCGGCGGRVTVQRPDGGAESGRAQYKCYERHMGRGSCAEASVSCKVADAAVLEQLCRLEGKPWQPQPLAAALNHDALAADRARLAAELAAAEAELQASVATLRSLGDLSDEVLAAFRRDAQLCGERIKQLKAQAEGLPPPRADQGRAQDVHAALMGTTIGREVVLADAAGDVAALRQLLELTVRGARIVERRTSGPAGRAVWARASVEWSPEVAVLFEAGLLALGPDSEAPMLPSRQEQAAERQRRYRERKRAAQPQ